MPMRSSAHAITAHPVPELARCSFLPRHFGTAAAEAARIGDLMASLAGDYRGGFWEFYELTNGGFYLAPVDAPRWRIVAARNNFDGVLSADSAGVVVTLRTLAQLALASDDGAVADRAVVDYFLLLDFAYWLPEAPLIFAAGH